MNNLRIALTGNPNSGKTTLFNALTGAKQRVGNWAGVTVERKEGNFTHGNTHIEVIDLPGIYSFSAFSMDEKVARDYILQEKPDLVINIVDASNLERNLYLTTQLLEMKVPMILVINMMDIALQKKIHIDIEHLAYHLDCPVSTITASKKEGIENLKDSILKHAGEKKIPRTQVVYDEIVEQAVKCISETLEKLNTEFNVKKRWLSIKLLENDKTAQEIVSNSLEDSASVDNIRKAVEKQAERISRHVGDETDIVIADGRYGFIHGLVKDVVRRETELRRTVSDIIDRVALNRTIGVPLFLGVMYLVFLITINVGDPFINFFDRFTGAIFVDGFAVLLRKMKSPEALTVFLANGIGGGIQVVATFIPRILFMFLSLAILEDSGYMARAAFIMDRFMRFIGLPGKAFIPMLVGFGCNVPAIMATRTLDNNKDRLLSILINPFMSCGARMPVYVLFASVFFGKSGGTYIFLIYLIGIVLAILSGLLFKKTILKGEISTFVMELPPYHIPTFNGIMLHTWQKLKSFIWKAGQVILVVVIVLNILSAVGADGTIGDHPLDQTLLSEIGKAITPIFHPMGISSNNWPATVGLFTGIMAKEAVVGTLDALYSSDLDIEADEGEFSFWKEIGHSFLEIPEGFRDFGNAMKDPSALSQVSSDVKNQESGLSTSSEQVMLERFGSKSAAFAYMLFILIYAPCIAVIGAVYRETNFKWMTFSLLYLTLLAWLLSTFFYQIATFAIHPASSAMWLGIVVSVIAIFAVSLRFYGKRNDFSEGV